MEEPTESPEILTDPEGEVEAIAAEEPTEEIETGEVTDSGEDQPPLELVDDEFSLPRVLEAILFASQKPVSLKELQNFCKGAAQANLENPRVAAFAKLKEATIREAFVLLQAGYAESGRTFELRETATGWQLVTKPNYAPWLRQLFPENRPARLSAPAVETLAIIAYRQPVTRADLEAVRGVAVDGVMQSLLDRELVKIAGRADVPGRPLLYETTQHFMEHFGLKSLEELPNGAELRRAKLPVATPEPTTETASEAAPDASEPTGDEAGGAVAEVTEITEGETNKEVAESEAVVEDLAEVELEVSESAEPAEEEVEKEKEG